MARVLYTGAVEDFKGSIGSQTFQRVYSGNITKIKNFPKRVPSLKTKISSIHFSEIARNWSFVSPQDKALWSYFLPDNVKVNYWGEEKICTSYNAYVSINSTRLLLGLPITNVPPNYSPEGDSPEHNLLIADGVCKIIFIEEFVATYLYTLIFASPPIRSFSYKNRKNLRLIKILEPGVYNEVDITPQFEAYYSIDCDNFTAADSFYIFSTISVVDVFSFLSSVFGTHIFKFPPT